MEMRLPATVDQLPVLYLVDWLQSTSNTGRVSDIKKKDWMLEDLPICQLERLLGMEKYVAYIFERFWLYVEIYIPSCEEVSTIECMGLSRDGPLFTCIEQLLARMKFYDEIPDSKVLDVYMRLHAKYGTFIHKAVGKEAGNATQV
ncbi:uncharacterized protein BDR25DRAFT_371052 [Lindgomyces ingoldianus]|uniref:Uncharacterized protein n=1 Tax=Lindgomyces ingoldianus TaxID=673940 RepID=A0ACB6RCU3_9PLEO|nr:uncharacterized protein BDR25DRAFT_371052 [Lindgomyces ingoldianus]KAF2477103.1 hypothetical protein BDR25DRAFT_371052 [Lindgomyces ingoldianus]